MKRIHRRSRVIFGSLVAMVAIAGYERNLYPRLCAHATMACSGGLAGVHRGRPRSFRRALTAVEKMIRLLAFLLALAGCCFALPAHAAGRSFPRRSIPPRRGSLPGAWLNDAPVFVAFKFPVRIRRGRPSSILRASWARPVVGLVPVPVAVRAAEHSPGVRRGREPSGGVR